MLNAFFAARRKLRSLRRCALLFDPESYCPATAGVKQSRSAIRVCVLARSGYAGALFAFGESIMHLLEQAAVFLLTAVLMVPLFQRLKLGAVLGYLAAGMVIGPWGLGVVGEMQSTLQFAEFGVVLLLFLIGLELDPARLWALRRSVFGLGGAQVAATGAVLGAIAMYFGLSWQAALIAGLGGEIGRAHV